MSKSKTLYRLIVILLYGSINFHCNSQVTNGSSQKERLSILTKINLSNVHGRIDHITYDSVNHLAFVAALGNNSVEVIDIDKKEVVKTITGLSEPQGIVYIPSLKKLVVANGDNGDCVFFDTRNYTSSGIVHLKGDADNIRYDPTSHLIYVGYGNGGIAVIDANSIKQIANIPLDDHPESFQLSKKLNRIYINVPDANEIEVADLSINKVIAKWKNGTASSNFPMGLDEKNDRLFICYRSPAKLAMIDAKTGKDISVVNCSGDADDIFYNDSDSLVFVSAGKGFIDAFKVSKNALMPISHIKTTSGARTSFLLRSEKKLLLAVPAHAGNPAALWIYNLN